MASSKKEVIQDSWKEKKIGASEGQGRGIFIGMYKYLAKLKNKAEVWLQVYLVPGNKSQKEPKISSPSSLCVSTCTLYSFFAHLFTSHEDSFDVVH